MKYIKITILLFTLTSCSLFKSQEKWIDANKIESVSKDFEDHLVSLGENYIQSPDIKTIKLSRSSNKYLTSMYNRLVNNFESLFKVKYKPKFYIIKNRTPFYFSLPRANFYFSSGFLKKFVKNEELLAASLSGEVVKSLRGIYQKQTVVPVGYMRTERMLSIVRIPFETKSEINKWAYFTLKRSGYDPSVYLTLLQLQNRNTLEFSLQYGNVQSISREEFLFKNFISQKGKTGVRGIRKKNGRKHDFYKMINELKRN
jgi:hypothetical protein